jgi:serine phosphatase RsbU (regulator of sigma subunit)
VHADGRYDWFDAEPGPPIGLTAPRSTATCHLDVGDTLVCYTDGLVEHHEEPIEAGRRRLLDVATAAADATLETLVAGLTESVPN